MKYCTVNLNHTPHCHFERDNATETSLRKSNIIVTRFSRRTSRILWRTNELVKKYEKWTCRVVIPYSPKTRASCRTQYSPCLFLFSMSPLVFPQLVTSTSSLLLRFEGLSRKRSNIVKIWRRTSYHLKITNYGYLLMTVVWDLVITFPALALFGRAPHTRGEKEPKPTSK